MHYTGTIWRPPYEASSLLLEATAGCTHHGCKFCTLYNDLPFPFRMSPLADIEADSIGCFARVTDVTLKSDEELAALHKAGYDGLTIGMETADDEALAFMDKGYLSADILEQCGRLDGAGIHYNFFYLTGISGAGRGEEGARLTAAVCNSLHPGIVGANMLTLYPDSRLYGEMEQGNWREESETEKYREVRTLIAELKIPTVFAAMGASNAYQMWGELPEDREKLLSFLDGVIENVGEDELRRYRKRVHHL